LLLYCCCPRCINASSYIYLDGVLRQVPACRADLFSDKVLSLSDKRSMGRFLSACVEAQQGCGRLKVRQAGGEEAQHEAAEAGCLVLMQMMGTWRLARDSGQGRVPSLIMPNNN
jgi:hypothetical protein